MDPNRVESVERALTLLQCFGAAGETLTLAQLAQRSGLYKSTILRLAGSLIRKGFIHKDDRGLYLLGSELSRLGLLARQPVDLESVVRPVLRRLADTTQETAAFFVRSGNERICLFRENSPRAVRHHLIEGGRLPLAPGAPSKIFSAYSKATLSDADLETRRRGWAISDGERDPELFGTAVPVLNGASELLGVLILSAIITRFTAEQQKAARVILAECAGQVQSQVRDVKLSDIAPMYE